jgi:hypothetical protein
MFPPVKVTALGEPVVPLVNTYLIGLSGLANKVRGLVLATGFRSLLSIMIVCCLETLGCKEVPTNQETFRLLTDPTPHNETGTAAS